MFCQTSLLLTSKSARDLANICQGSSLTLCLSPCSDLGSMHRYALPQGLVGSPHVLQPSGPSCKHIRVGSLHPPKVQPHSTMPEMPLCPIMHSPLGSESHAGHQSEGPTDMAVSLGCLGEGEGGGCADSRLVMGAGAECEVEPNTRTEKQPPLAHPHLWLPCVLNSGWCHPASRDQHALIKATKWAGSPQKAPRNLTLKGS